MLLDTLLLISLSDSLLSPRFPTLLSHYNKSSFYTKFDRLALVVSFCNPHATFFTQIVCTKKVMQVKRMQRLRGLGKIHICFSLVELFLDPVSPLSGHVLTECYGFLCLILFLYDRMWILFITSLYSDVMYVSL